MGEAGLDLQRAVADTYRDIAADDERVMVLDARADPEELAAQVFAASLRRSGRV
jgi:thymidylate kinase